MYYYTAPGGGFSTGSITKLIDKTVTEVFRDGIFYRPNDSTLPQGKEFNFDSATGEVSFDTTGPPLGYQEKVSIKYIDPAGVVPPPVLT